MPAKRHPSLIPLSHDHHHGLVLTFRLRQGLPRTRKPSDSPQEQAESAIGFFHDSLAPHFRAEEEILFPAMRARLPQAHALLTALMTEHTEMRTLVERLIQDRGEVTLLPPLLKSFGDVLERHIRCEERELFPLYEAQIPEEDAARIGSEITRLLGR